ncbi:MAG: hypothetical protein QWI73_06600 [Alphaproteobacteria bacterium]|nr:hypothetical protein [Alphaproteobacteria bacterium]
MDEMPSRVAARRQLQKAQRAAIINGAGQGGSHLLLLLRWTVLYGRLQLALVGGSLAASVLLIFAGSYLQFTSSSSSSSLSSKTSSSASELHHPQQLNTTSLISGLLAIDLEAFRARRALFNKAGEEEEEDFAESSSVLIFVGATSATVELLLLLAILLEHFKGSLAISLLLGGGYLWYVVTSWSSTTSTLNSAASAASATFQLALLLASLLYTATIKVKVRLADRVLLLQQKSVDKDEMRLEEMRRRRRNNA